MRIEKFNESFDEKPKDIRSVINDIYNILTDLTDNGFNIRHILLPSPERSHRILIEITPDIARLFSESNPSVIIHWNEDSESMKEYSKHLSIIVDHIDEIKDRLGELENTKVVDFELFKIDYTNLAIKIRIVI